MTESNESPGSTAWAVGVRDAAADFGMGGSFDACIGWANRFSRPVRICRPLDVDTLLPTRLDPMIAFLLV